MDNNKGLVIEEFTEQMKEVIDLLEKGSNGFEKLPEGSKRWYATFYTQITQQLALNKAKNAFDINALKCVRESISPQWLPGVVKKLYETGYKANITNEGWGAPIPKGEHDANFTLHTIGSYKTGFGLTWEQHQTQMTELEDAIIVMESFANTIAEELKKEVASILKDSVVQTIEAGEFNYENHQKVMTKINRGKTSTELQLIASPESFDEYKVIKYKDKSNMVYAETMIQENSLSSSSRTAKVSGRYDLIEFDEFREFALEGEEEVEDEGKIVVYITDGYVIDYSHTGAFSVTMPEFLPTTDVFSGVMRFPYGIFKLPGATVYKVVFDKEAETKTKTAKK